MIMHVKKPLVGLALLLIGASAFAGAVESGVISKIHNASKDIKQSANHDSIAESIYKQIRPRVNITNTVLGAAETDRIVRSYVYEKCAPALINNYAQLYSQLKAAKKDLTTCEDLNPFNLTKDVLAALCVKTQAAFVRVQYLINSYGRGWSTSTIYVFSAEGSALRLSSIELQLKEGAKAYVEGL